MLKRIGRRAFIVAAGATAGAVAAWVVGRAPSSGPALDDLESTSPRSTSAPASPQGDRSGAGASLEPADGPAQSGDSAQSGELEHSGDFAQAGDSEASGDSGESGEGEPGNRGDGADLDDDLAAAGSHDDDVELHAPQGAGIDRVVAVGRAYLRDRPHEGDVAWLLAALGASADDYLRVAELLVASDFADGRTVSLDGWVLSESEGRAAALVALACAGEC